MCQAEHVSRPTRVVVVLTVAGLLAAGCARSDGDEPLPTGGVDCTYTVVGAAAKQADPPQSSHVANTGEAQFSLEFAEGKVEVTMNRAAAPCAINSFESLAEQGFYAGTKCHRLVDSGGFLLQCGDPSGTGRGGPGYVFPDELSGSETYGAGTVAMANSGPNTNGSQFFLVYRDTELPPAYVVLGKFGEEGRKVLERIAAEGQDGSNPDGSGRPNNPAEIKSVTAG